MIRVRIAAALLRTTGATVEYAVRRVNSKLQRGKGRVVLLTPKLKEAVKKYQDMRVADTDTITITVQTVVAKRHGTVEGGSNVTATN